MIGTTLEEMPYFSTAEDLGLETKPRRLLLSQLQSTVGPRAPAVLDEYQRLYPKWGDAVVQITSDAIMRFPAIQLADALSAHVMELPLVFGTVNFPEVIVFTGRDPHRHELADKVMDSWIAFARSGNPTLPSGTEWRRHDSNRRQTMELGPTIRLIDDPSSDQRKVWGATVPTVEQGRVLLQANQ